MKFTQGYWMIKDGYNMSYATHAFRVQKKEKALEVISTCRAITNRGAILDGGALTVTFTAPRENIIRVKVFSYKNPCILLLDIDTLTLIIIIFC